MKLYGQRSPLRKDQRKRWIAWNHRYDEDISGEMLLRWWLGDAAIAERRKITLGEYRSLLQMDVVIHELSWLMLSRRIRTRASADRLMHNVISN